MADIEKVIKGLECCASMNGSACRECPYSSECVAGEATYQTGTAHLAADALELLKAQEPRVMTLKEIISAECVWIEYATSGNVVIALPWDIELTDDTYNFIGMPNCFVEFRSLYGEEWRCWTSRPTDEQRKAAKWE